MFSNTETTSTPFGELIKLSANVASEAVGSLWASPDDDEVFHADHVSPIAGIQFGDAVTDDMKQALHAFGLSRRLSGYKDLSPAAYIDLVSNSIIDYGEGTTIENIYHAARKGWGSFYFKDTAPGILERAKQLVDEGGEG